MNTLKEKIEKEELLHAEDLEEFFVNIIKKRNLSHIVDKILISSKEISGFFSKENQITINLNELWFKTKGIENIRTNHDCNIININEKRKNTCDNYNKINIYNIASFYHEVRHAYQLDTLLNLLNENGVSTLYEALLYKNLLTSTFIESLQEPYSTFFYNKYHNYFFDEYDANISSYMDVINLFNSFQLPNLKEILQLYNKLIAANIYMLYKDIKRIYIDSTPSLNMIKLYNVFYKINGKQFEDEFLSFDKIYNMNMPKYQIDRLKLGLKLDNKTLNYIYEVTKGKSKTLNLFDDIKNI